MYSFHSYSKTHLAKMQTAIKWSEQNLVQIRIVVLSQHVCIPMVLPGTKLHSCVLRGTTFKPGPMAWNYSVLTFCLIQLIRKNIGIPESWTKLSNFSVGQITLKINATPWSLKLDLDYVGKLLSDMGLYMVPFLGGHFCWCTGSMVIWWVIICH